MHQATHEGEAQIEERLEQLESENMKMKETLIRHGYVLEVSNGDSGGRFHQASRQQVELQEEVEEFANELLEAQAAWRKARDYNLRRYIEEVSRQLQEG